MHTVPHTRCAHAIGLTGAPGSAGPADQVDARRTAATSAATRAIRGRRGQPRTGVPGDRGGLLAVDERREVVGPDSVPQQTTRPLAPQHGQDHPQSAARISRRRAGTTLRSRQLLLTRLSAAVDCSADAAGPTGARSLPASAPVAVTPRAGPSGEQNRPSPYRRSRASRRRSSAVSRPGSAGSRPERHGQNHRDDDGTDTASRLHRAPARRNQPPASGDQPDDHDHDADDDVLGLRRGDQVSRSTAGTLAGCRPRR